jgi:hypothetical protein
MSEQYKYDNLLYPFLIQDIENGEEEQWYPKGVVVNLAYEKDEEKLLKMGVKGICTTADEMIYHYVDEQKVNLDKLSAGDKIMLDAEFVILDTLGTESIKENKMNNNQNTQFGGDTGIDADYLYEHDQINESIEPKRNNKVQFLEQANKSDLIDIIMNLRYENGLTNDMPRCPYDIGEGQKQCPKFEMMEDYEEGQPFYCSSTLIDNSKGWCEIGFKN